MKYIMGEIVSGYDSENVYNFYILNPMIMLGNEYPLNDMRINIMRGHYIDRNNNPNINNVKIIGYISQEDLEYPLLYIKKNVIESYTKLNNEHISLVYNSGNKRRQFLSCIRTENTFFVELSVLEIDDCVAMSLLDLYVLYLEDIADSILPVETVELLISQLSESHKSMGLTKYYREFC